MQSVPITTDVIKFVSDLWQVDGAQVSSTNKTDNHDITEILLTMALNTITHKQLRLQNLFWTYDNHILHIN
jgi:hypothetical protein